MSAIIIALMLIALCVVIAKGIFIILRTIFEYPITILLLLFFALLLINS